MFVKNNVLNLSLVLISVVLFSSCGDIYGDLNNLFDPASPYYRPPRTRIISGPGPGSTLDTTAATFAWQPADSLYWPDSTRPGNIPARILYCYRLNYRPWSMWLSGEILKMEPMPNLLYNDSSGVMTLTLTGLEDGTYRFEVRSKYPTEVEEADWPHRVFSVDALDGPALIISPLDVYADSGATIITSVKVLEVAELMGAHFLLGYDPRFLRLVEYGIPTQAGELLAQKNGDVVSFVTQDSLAGTLAVDLSILGGSSPGVTGNGGLLRLRFEHIGAVAESRITIDQTSQLRNTANDNILNVIRDGRIIIY